MGKCWSISCSCASLRVKYVTNAAIKDAWGLGRMEKVIGQIRKERAWKGVMDCQNLHGP